jgi:hypothetical protein
MRESACCGARVEDDSDICLDCHEHCQLNCPDCEGGYVEVLADYQGDAITPRTKMVVCENCHGEGVIDAV